MEQVSVWIPTYKRPEMLRTALRSVAAQTAVKSIREVLVIENGLDDRSRNVCAEFSELPITYSLREESLPPGSKENTEAGKKTLRELHTRLVAILYDDDWWAPEHIERSLRNFAAVPKCVASFCTCMWTEGESSYLIGLLGDFIPWFAVGGCRTAGCWALGLSDLIVASQIATAFHYSSMVIDKEIYIACLEALGHENPFDTDRNLSVELGSHGTVVCESTPGVYVRVHPSTESTRLERSGEAKHWFRVSTDRIVERARSHGLDLQKEFAARLQSTGASFKHIREMSHLQNIDYLIQRGVLSNALQMESPALVMSRAVLKATMPPLLYKGMTSIVRSFR